uniref:Tripartite motif-containing protein 16-like n=1 Tax=Electrophorus electricus TaxID=8005 RepID=A0A4W4EPG6_ELEEL
MAEVRLSEDQHQFSCPVCLDLLKDPVAIPCGHSFCMVCINDCWYQDDQRGVYSCPQCRETFTPRPVLRRNYMLVEVVEKLKKTEFQAASPVHCYAGPGDVECDSCTGRKHKAIKSCLVCLASFCETHIRPHYQSSAFKKHTLVKASSRLQEKICSEHDKLTEIFCCTDQSFICYLCMMDEHKGHDTVSVAAERNKKQVRTRNLIETVHDNSISCVELLVSTEQRAAGAAISEPLLQSVRELIRDQEKTGLSQAEGLLDQLEQEIADLKKRDTELEQLSHTEDHIHFLQANCVSSGSVDSYIISVHQHPSFDGVKKSLSDLKEQIETFCKEEFSKISPHGNRSNRMWCQKWDGAVETIRSVFMVKNPPSAVRGMMLPPEPKTREDFLKYFCQLTLDPNTAHRRLILSERNRVVTNSKRVQPYSDHRERFNYWTQVLCKESVCGRCYWEVEWSSVGWVFISVSYKDISRKGRGNECVFGHNTQSWSLVCSSNLSFWHNNIETEISDPPSSRIGVYVDHSAGTLSFYRVSDTMTLLHTVHTTFTQPLYAEFWVYGGSTVRLCDIK